MRTPRTLARLLGIGMLAATLATPAQAAPAATDSAGLDAALRPYVKVGGVSGKLSSIGSDTMNNLMTLWAESFKKLYPNVSVEVQGAG